MEEVGRQWIFMHIILTLSKLLTPVLKVTSISSRISWWHQFIQKSLRTHPNTLRTMVILNTFLEHLHLSSILENIAKNKYFSHPSFSLLTFFFPTPPIKLKLRLQVGGRLVTATPWKNISHIQVFVTNFFFPNPTNKTETAIASRWETSNCNNPLGPIKLSSQSETWSTPSLSMICLCLLHLFQGSILHGYVVCCSRVPAFLEWIYSWSSSKSHILSIGGDVITKTPNNEDTNKESTIKVNTQFWFT
jgi:hypothetical protein